MAITKLLARFMGHYHDRSLETVAQLENEIVEQARGDEGSRPTEGSSKKSISGSREIARAIAEYGYGGGITIVKD